MALAMPSLANITWDRVEREHSVTYPCPAPDKPGQDIVFGDGFPTPSGRGKFVPAKLISPAEETGRGLPLCFDDGPPARALAHRLHDAPVERARRSRAGGDCMPLRARHGTAGGVVGPEAARQHPARNDELKARIDGAVPPGLIFIPFAYAEAAANILTNPQLDPLAKSRNSNIARLESNPRVRLSPRSDGKRIVATA